MDVTESEISAVYYYKNYSAMNIIWEINDSDAKRAIEFVSKIKNPLVDKRLSRNINRENIGINKESILRTMLLSLMTFQQHSSINPRVISFMSKKPFPVLYKPDMADTDYLIMMFSMFEEHGLAQFVPKVPNFFLKNITFLEKTNWALIPDLKEILEKEAGRDNERILADRIDQMFKGFGSKQARVFLQILGITRYEIPIDKQTLVWLKDFGLPVLFSPNALQDKGFYHLISDGIQLLCEKAEIYPCVLDAAIFSSNTGQTWTKDNVIF